MLWKVLPKKRKTIKKVSNLKQKTAFFLGGFFYNPTTTPTLGTNPVLKMLS